jgi:transposase-like protein
LEAEEQEQSRARTHGTTPAAEEPKRPREHELEIESGISLQISLFYSPDNNRSFDKRSRVSLILPEGQHKELEVVFIHHGV